MNALEILIQAKEELIRQAQITPTLSNQIAEISEAIRNLQFCKKHRLSSKDEVIELEPLNNFGYTKLVKCNDDDKSYGDHCKNGSPIQLFGFELIIKRKNGEKT